MTLKKLTIVIPCYNEKGHIAQLIERVKQVDLGPIEREIIVVDDGSTDGTRERLNQIAGLTAIFHQHNLGKGGAVKSGFQAATGEVVLIQDADLEYSPSDYPALIRPLIEDRADVSNGIRQMPPHDVRRHKSLYWASWLGNLAITWLTNILYWHYSAEYEGGYKAFKTEIIRSIPVKTNDFDFDNELICKILKRGYRIVDVPIHYHPRNYQEGKKINWRHGLLILWTIIKYRFVD